MLRLILSSVRHNRGRYLATLVAIITGVMFYAATGFLSEGIIDSLEGDVDREFGAVDVAVVADPDAAAEAAEPLVIPGRRADRILGLDGVEAGAGTLTGPSGFVVGGDPVATDATARLWVTDDELNPLDVEEGEAPSAAGEIAVDRGLAEDQGFAVGDDVTLLTVAGPQDVTIVGTTRFADSDALDSAGTVSVPEASAFDWLRDGHREYDNLYLRASGSPDALLDEVEAVTPPAFEAVDGEDFREQQKESSGSFGRVIKQGLQAFAILALLVGGFVIYNTFSVIVAQRQRELAVLSALGATGKQLKRSLRYEGLVIGLAGSAIGVVVGYVLVVVMALLLQLFGVDLPGGGAKITSGTILGGLVLGTVITVVSVMVPARRAGRTEPIAAMQDAAVETGTLSRGRAIASAVLAGLGLLAMFFGPNAPVIGLGAVLFVAALLVGAPFVAVAVARLSRPIMHRFGLEGRLAVDNSVRNPKRTATTANALVIGVLLVTFVSVAGSSIRDFAVETIDELQSADYVVSSEGGTVDPDLVSAIESIDEVEAVTPYRRETVTVDGDPALISSGDLAALGEETDLTVLDGSLDDLSGGAIAVLEGTGTVGDTVAVEDLDGQTVDLDVVAVLAVSLDAAQLGDLVDEETFEELVGDVAPTAAIVDVAVGKQSETEEEIQDIADLRPDITIMAGNALGNLIGGIFDFAINAVTGLLLMSVVIALIGIINTMSLSILERRRELGLLRIVGMTDRRVRRMVRLESVLIALMGTLTGMVAGIVLSLAVTTGMARLAGVSVGFTVPWLTLVAVLVAGSVLGFLAALVPARRSTKLSALDAVQAT
ncbi:putative ABC transport system permease protein [Mumia flava]|uniref:Putative ABC transport system permease protein n=1 Tax=Mumia flava TaxID=1348852 RepID=A0A0B2BQR2_9ACTN|nr:FtsX-like permease family protein [Mumia flava]PJJ54169.1 putative ABC transport system permease protein [Mumia flava]